MKNKNIFNLGPARLIFFGGLDKAGKSDQNLPESQAPAPMGPTDGVAIDTGTTALSDKEVSPEESKEGFEKFRSVRMDMANAIEGILPLSGSESSMETRVKNALSNINIPPVVKKVLDAKLNNPQHVYTVDTGSHFVEIELVSRSETTTETLVSIYKKDAVPENKHDVKDTKTFLDFKAKAIKDLDGVASRADVIEKGKELIQKYPAIRATVADSPYMSQHLISAKLSDGEVVDIRLDYDKNKDYLIIQCRPWRAPGN